ncbi:MAG: MBL fold metallo-hydrolase [Bacteroidales bacterium]
MKVFPIITENWKMDGGVAFGVVPRTMWQKLAEPDENNLVKITTRCLLVDTGEKRILFDTGMGRKQNEKYYGFRFLFGDDNLEDSLKSRGYELKDITDVVFTHLHDDHVGGAVKIGANGKPELVFKNAMHYCSKDQWEWANFPNKREIGSFFKENFSPIDEAGKLTLIEDEGEFCKGIHLRIMNGHTVGMIIPIIHLEEKSLAFMADFIPSSTHIPLPYIASVDIQPLVALKEKEAFLNEAAENNYTLIFQHDYDVEACTVKHTENGVRA